MSAITLVNPFVMAGAAVFDIVAIGTAALTASNTPSVTFGGYTPALDDAVALFCASTSGAAIGAEGSGWANMFTAGTIVTPADGTVAIAGVTHRVTSGEVSAVTTTYSVPGLFNVTETGEVIGLVVRGAHATLLDSANSAFNASPVTPHVLPGLTGADLSNGSLVVSAVFPDAMETYSTPSGWTLVSATTGTNQGGAVFRRDTLTAAGVDITATNITPSASDEYASITIAIAAA
jgi:hypothetical protein